jgi:DNA-binding response OmpR family regulator
MSYLLLLDGLPEPRREYRAVLETAGYRTRVALTQEDALALARNELPQAVLVEASAGQDLALRFVAALRRHPVLEGVPILVLSSHVDRGMTEALSSQDGVAWLAEPCSPRTLLEEVQYVTTPARHRFWGVEGHPRTSGGQAEPAERRRGRWRDDRMRRTWGGEQAHH